jgi:hypothetical protein
MIFIAKIEIAKIEIAKIEIAKIESWATLNVTKPR